MSQFVDFCRSDHTAVLIELKDIPPIPSHRPCALSSTAKFRQQPTLKSMFSRQKRRADDQSEKQKKLKKEDQTNPENPTNPFTT